MDIRERIITGAGKLFYSKGIKRVTMDDISTEIGMSKRTIYENFRDKTEILRATVDFLSDKHRQEVDQMQSGSGNVMEVIIKILLYGLKSIDLVSPMYLEDMQKFYPLLWEETIQKGRISAQKQLQDLLERGKKEGLFRSEINTGLVARIFYEQLNLIHSNEAFPIEEFPRKELFENMFLNFARGISTRKGVEVMEELLVRSSY
ncbi:TetR/AcrR family transcriptional regulator [Marinilabilia salmonicolor]|jgi:AcrR family transcriptional regulator|uniref:TetR family transcriptional regulator n=1 Tax=Marinilabilia salmonicolor TaxID=989 RepID=A0A368UQR3_9BACT|nr:TetR/AcrR family transcriptional regulator [Marinilabilia salmonicolor]RCW31043.1 TetR family transcriptional regulator [Marinilabilia salmonicolor]